MDHDDGRAAAALHVVQRYGRGLDAAEADRYVAEMVPFAEMVGVPAEQVPASVQALRTAAVVRLLLHNALRVDEACAADLADLGEDSGHRVLRVVRKGARKAKIPLTPANVWSAIQGHRLRTDLAIT